MIRERFLVTVMTYPTLSRNYGQLVCTAGLRVDGSWIRIHPVALGQLGMRVPYQKFDWIELNLAKSRRDRRPETYAPVDLPEIRVVGHVGHEDDWRERRQLLLGTAKAYTQLQPLVRAAGLNRMSLALFKPGRILKFFWRKCEREWPREKVRALEEESRQCSLFDGEHPPRRVELIPKLPYHFYYRFSDADGEIHTMRVLDWDVGKLYWKTLEARRGLESLACSSVHKTYFEEYRKTDHHFVLGTTRRFGRWVIVGVLPFPFQERLDGV